MLQQTYHVKRSKRVLVMDDIKNAIRKVNGHVMSNQKVIEFITPYGNGEQEILIANLSLMYSQAGERVVILDTKFNSTAFSSTFNVTTQYGLSDFLSHTRIGISNIIESVPNQNIDLISAGKITNSKTNNLIDDPRMETLLVNLKESYGRVLINVPKINVRSGTSNQRLYDISDVSFLICDIGTPKRILVKTMNVLSRWKVNVAGYISVKK